MDFLKGFNWVVVLGIVVAIETQIGNGTMSLANMVPESWIPYVKAWAANLGSVGALIMSAGAFGPRPQGQFTVTPAVKSAIVVAIAFGALFAFAPSAHAQGIKLVKPTGNVAADAKSAATETDPATGDTKCNLIWDPLKLCGALTGKPTEDIQRVVKRIQGIGRDDMNYAILKATAAGTNGAKVRLQCLQAIMDAKNAAEGVGIKDANGNVVPRPDPAFVTAIEDVAELIDGLSPTGPLMTGCAGAAQLFKTNTLAAINAIVTGAAGIAALPAGL